MRKKKAAALLAIGAVSALVLAGCAAETDTSNGTDDTGSDTDTDNSTDEAGSAFSQLDLSGIEIAVGSKDFDEQLILGEMLVAAFEEAGATVDDKVNLGGTSVARAALESGDIDVYMEYNGTGWAVHLGEENPSFDPEELTSGVRELDRERNNIEWIGRSPFNNTYGFTSSPETTEANGGAFTIQSMMEYVEANPDAVVCMESEYPDRPDGLILMETATGIELPDDQQRILDTGIIYTETAANNCDFGEVYTTDGRIPALGLTLVEDPGVHVLYNVSGTMVGDTYDQAPEVFDEIIESILAPLDNERMASINARVSADGEDPAVVARDYLASEGLID
ncbi:MAG TPA: glycine betaine ABC transporter substrate-binding protein [Microbacteriaceae bacterium]